jgi:hypothetical protein
LIEEEAIALVLDERRGERVREARPLDAGRSGRGGGVYSFGDAHRYALFAEGAYESRKALLHSARRRKRRASTMQECGIVTAAS